MAVSACAICTCAGSRLNEQGRAFWDVPKQFSMLNQSPVYTHEMVRREVPPMSVVCTLSGSRSQQSPTVTHAINRVLIVVAMTFSMSRAPAGEASSAAGDAEVRLHRGVPALFVEDRPTFPVAMIPIGDFPTEACREFADAGVRLYSHIIWNWRSITPGVDEPLSEPNRWWLGPGQYDFDKIDRRLEAVLAAHPDARIFPRVKLNPPDWWLNTHPDDITRTEDGQLGGQHSMASRAWRERMNGFKQHARPNDHGRLGRVPAEQALAGVIHAFRYSAPSGPGRPSPGGCNTSWIRPCAVMISVKTTT